MKKNTRGQSAPEVTLTMDSWQLSTELAGARRASAGTANRSSLHDLGAECRCADDCEVCYKRPMSIALNTDELERFQQLAQTVTELRAASKKFEQLRDSEFRRLRAAGVSVIDLANVAGLTRFRVYQILEQPVDDFDVPEYLERFDAAFDHALDEWEAAGRDGDLDDYFPLEALLK